MNDILFKEDSINALKVGIDKLAKTVRITAGPMGKNVVIDKGNGATDITNDGVTVARSITLSDPVENMGAHMVKEVATDTETIAGDGTTTAIILLQAMVEGGVKHASLGSNVMDIKKGMDIAVHQLVAALEKAAVSIDTDPKAVIKVATISANNDETLGSLIAEAFHHVGNHGVISVENSNTIKTDLMIVEGMRIDRGWMSPYFMTDQRTGDAVLEDPYILVTDSKIMSPMELNAAIELVPEGSPIVLFVDDIEATALSGIILYHTQQKLNMTCVKTPGFGDSKIDLTGDLCAAVGAEFICTGKGSELSNITIDSFGRASKIIVSRDDTVIIGGQSDEALVQSRIENVKNLLESEMEDYPRQVLEKRLGSLTNGVAIIRVGAASETEVKEKMYRIEDALAATRSAIDEGIVAGGGVALINAIDKIDHSVFANNDQKLGADIVLNAAAQPFTAILENGGLTPEVVLGKMEKEKPGYGLNVKTGEYGMLIKAGVVDPVKVTKAALRNAESVASMILTTEAVVFETPELI